jgi:hypothetical protein
LTAPGVGLHDAAGDQRPRRGAQAGGAGIGNDAQVGAAEAAARRLLRGDGDQRPAALAASAAGRPRALAADEALVKLDDAARQELALAMSQRLGDLATHQPCGLDGDAELAGRLGRRRRLLRGGEQPDGEEPLAQIGAREGRGSWRRSGCSASGSSRTRTDRGRAGTRHARAHSGDRRSRAASAARRQPADTHPRRGRAA